jgi:hypothetical protein
VLTAFRDRLARNRRGAVPSSDSGVRRRSVIRFLTKPNWTPLFTTTLEAIIASLIHDSHHINGLGNGRGAPAVVAASGRFLSLTLTSQMAE